MKKAARKKTAKKKTGTTGKTGKTSGGRRKTTRPSARKTSGKASGGSKNPAGPRLVSSAGVELQAALTDLAGAFERLGAALGQGVLQLAETAGQSVAEKARQKRGAGSGPNPPRDRGSRRLSPQQRSRLKLQGRYMAATRFLSDADKAKVRRTREASGIEAAIEQALGIGGGKRGK